jgi:alanine-synthesizing transaminase
MPTRSSRPAPVAQRVNRFSYAIRNIVAEAQAVEARGTEVRYLNIGDPVAFGFQTPAHLIDAATRAMRDGKNGYLPSVGIRSAREAVAADYTRRGVPTSPDRVLITTGSSEGIELALNALVDEGDDVLVPLPTYPLYTAILAKVGAQPRYYRTDPNRDWLPDLDHLRSLITPRTRVLVVIDPNNPTGAVYPASIRRSLIELAERSRDRCRCWGRLTSTRQSSRFRACPRRISPRGGAPVGSSSDRIRDWMTRWQRSRSWQMDACAAPDRCSMRSPRR